MVRPESQVSLPKVNFVAASLLRLLHLRSTPVSPEDAYNALAHEFRLDIQQLMVRRRTRAELAWRNRVQTARRHLVDKGLLDNSVRGRWILTEAGRQRAQMVANSSLADL